MLKEFKEICFLRGYAAATPSESGSEAGYTLFKAAGGTILLAQAINLNLILSPQIIAYLHDLQMARATEMAASGQKIWVVFLWFSDDVPVFPDIEPYYGQSPYAVYWHINCKDKTVTVPKGQPSSILDLREALDEALGNKSSSAQFGPAQSFPAFTIFLLLANVIIAAQMYARGLATDPSGVVLSFGALSHALVSEGEVWRLFTSMFIHFDFWHLLNNMVALLIFGTRVEKYFGSANFIAIYIFSGIFASVATLYVLPWGISAGASGAVYGIIGAALAYILFTKRSMDVLNLQVMLVILILSFGISFMVTEINLVSHVGGFIAGLLTGRILAGRISRADTNE